MYQLNNLGRSDRRVQETDISDGPWTNEGNKNAKSNSIADLK